MRQDQAKELKELQKDGLAISRDVVSVQEACDIMQKTPKAIYDLRAELPGRKEKGGITWWVVGSLIVLDRKSLIEVALERGWIEPAGKEQNGEGE